MGMTLRQSDSAMMTIGQVAEFTGCCERTIREQAKKGGFPKPARIGRLVRWHRDVIERFLRGEWTPETAAAVSA